MSPTIARVLYEETDGVGLQTLCSKPLVEDSNGVLEEEKSLQAGGTPPPIISTEGDQPLKRKPINPENVKAISKMMQAIYSVRLLKQDNLATEILDGVFLGSYGVAQHKENLKKAGIKYILCIASSLQELFPESFHYKTIQIMDEAEANLKQHFGTCIAFINKAVRSRSPVLVHCYAGKSRSASVIAAWLIKARGFTLHQAINLLKEKRPVVQPNMGFMMQLTEFEQEVNSEDLKRKSRRCMTTACCTGAN